MTSAAFPCPVDDSFKVQHDELTRAVFFGLGSDGTVGANKNSIKIIAENTDNFAQGYFVYDSKKAGSVTTSHVRFSPNPIQSSYLIDKAEFVACHVFSFLNTIDVLERAATGATFLLNTTHGKTDAWASCQGRSNRPSSTKSSSSMSSTPIR